MISAIVLLVIIFIFIAVFILERYNGASYFDAPLHKISTSGKKCIALTFDDGPDDFTHEIVNLLGKFNIKASFFLVGKHMSKHHELIQFLIHHGHTIGNHTFSHKNLAQLKISEIIKEISMFDDECKKLSLNCPKIMRPPFGYKGYKLALALLILKKKLVMWSNNCKSQYFLRYDPETLIQEAISSIKPGDIILFHGAFAPNRLVYISALECIIVQLLNKGYEFKPIQ